MTERPGPGGASGAPAWTAGLARWYAQHGRHRLPWRETRDPWAILVSEMMLVQTPVPRVHDRYRAFLDRWPDPPSCAAASLADILRLWQGLGYPRRARYLHECAAAVASGGWPHDEAGLRALPGVGPYMARALLTFAWERPAAPPREVNLARVAARAAAGAEPHEVSPARLDHLLVEGRPGGMPSRHYAYALFDVGALHCRARAPRCSSCPLVSSCRSGARLAIDPPAPAPRRQAPYAGSLRELRGAVLAAALATRPPATLEELRRRVGRIPAAARPGALEAALDGLDRDGLLPEPARSL